MSAPQGNEVSPDAVTDRLPVDITDDHADFQHVGDDGVVCIDG